MKRRKRKIKLAAIFLNLFLLAAMLPTTFTLKAYADTGSNITLGSLAWSNDGNQCSFSNATVSGESITSITINATTSIASVPVTPAPNASLANSSGSTTKTFIFNGGISAGDAQTFIRGIVFNFQPNASINITVDGNTTRNLPSGASITELNSHYYMYVSYDNPSWWDSYNAAKLYTFMGMKGYLATITSPEEDRVLTNISGNGAWAGGTRLVNNDGSLINDSNSVGYTTRSVGYFYWACGPEAGEEFNSSSNSQSAYNKSYIHWENGEPNANAGVENCLQVNYSNDRLWNDLRPNGSGIAGYFVEFSNYSNGMDSNYSPAKTSSASYTLPGESETSALAKINAGNGTLDDYAVIGTTGVTGDNLQCINLAVKTKRIANGSDLGEGQIKDVIKERVTLALANINGGIATLDDYKVVGITGVTADNLEDINAAAVKAKTSNGGVDLIEGQIQSVVGMRAAVKAINTSDASTMASAITDNAGTLGLDLTDYNKLTNSDKTAVQTALIGKNFKDESEIKIAFDAAVTKEKIAEAVAKINGGNGTLDDYTVAGITGVTESNLSFINEVVALEKKSEDNVYLDEEAIRNVVKTQVELALARINAGNGKVYDYTILGITGVTLDNLSDMDAAVVREKTAKGSNLIQDQIQPVINKQTAVRKINTSNDSTIASAITDNAEALGLDLTDYNRLTTAGKTTVQAALVGKNFEDASAVKNAFDAAVTSEKTAEGIEDGIAAINSGNGTLDDYKIVGITGVTADNLADINAAVARKKSEKGGAALEKDDIQELVNSQAASALAKINGGNGTLDDYKLAGITGVTSVNFSDMNAAVARKKSENGGADLTQSIIQSLVDAQTVVKAINTSDASTIAYVITENAEALGLDLTQYNNLSDSAKVIVQSALIGKNFEDASSVKSAFDAAVYAQEVVNRGNSSSNISNGSNSEHHSNSSSSSSSSSSGNSTSATEQITVKVTDGSSDNSIVQTAITRTTANDGTKTDAVTYTPDKAQETIAALAKEGKDTARIVATDSDASVAQTQVSIPKDTLSTLSSGNVNLEIQADGAIVSLPKESVQGLAASGQLSGDLYFRLVPIKDAAKQAEIKGTADMQAAVIAAAGNSGVQVLGTPMKIETNMGQRTVDITLPLTGVALPTDTTERQAFLDDLGVFIEHSDGEKVFEKGTIVDYGNGTFGIKFRTTKFSDFTIVKLNQNAKTGWKLTNGYWYFTKNDGTMATGWFKDSDGSWYFLSDSNDKNLGAMETGWKYINGAWYFLKDNGALTIGWQEINGTWYYLNSDGSMASDTTIDGYTLDNNGAWIE